MPKLHELLAVDSNLKGQALKLRTDLQSTFEKKRHLFAAKLVTVTPLQEGAEVETREQSDIQTSVSKEINWLLDTILVKSIDSADAMNTKGIKTVVIAEF